MRRVKFLHHRTSLASASQLWTIIHLQTVLPSTDGRADRIYLLSILTWSLNEPRGALEPTRPWDHDQKVSLRNLLASTATTCYHPNIPNMGRRGGTRLTTNAEYRPQQQVDHQSGVMIDDERRSLVEKAPAPPKACDQNPTRNLDDRDGACRSIREAIHMLACIAEKTLIHPEAGQEILLQVTNEATMMLLHWRHQRLGILSSRERIAGPAMRV